MMAFDREGNIFITDFNNNRIQKFPIIVNSCGMYGTCESSMPDRIQSEGTLGSGQSLTSNNNCYHIDGSQKSYLQLEYIQQDPCCTNRSKTAG